MKFEIYKSPSGFDPSIDWEYLWYWRLRSRNGKIIADGSEGYSSKAKVRRAVVRLRTSLWIEQPPIVEVEA